MIAGAEFAGSAGQVKLPLLLPDDEPLDDPLLDPELLPLDEPELLPLEEDPLLDPELVPLDEPPLLLPPSSFDGEPLVEDVHA